MDGDLGTVLIPGCLAAGSGAAVAPFEHPRGRLTSDARDRDRSKILGYLSTAAKHGLNQVTVLRDAVLGHPWMPDLPATTWHHTIAITLCYHAAIPCVPAECLRSRVKRRIPPVTT